MSSIIISLYVGYALYDVLPIGTILGNNTPAARTILSILVYAVLVGLSNYLLQRIGFGGRSKKPWHNIVLGILGLGFILALGYHLFAIERLITLSPTVTIFFTDTYFVWWFIAPLVGMFLLTL